MCEQQSLRSYGQSDQSLCSLLVYSMIVKLLTEHHLEFLSLKGSCRGSSVSTHVKIPHCCKSYALAQIKMKKGYQSCKTKKIKCFLTNSLFAGGSGDFSCITGATLIT